MSAHQYAQSYVHKVYVRKNQIQNVRTYVICHMPRKIKIKIKKRTKTPRITDEGWNSQKQLSDPVEKKMKEGNRRKGRTPVSSSGALFRFSFPIGFFYRKGIACRKLVY